MENKVNISVAPAGATETGKKAALTLISSITTTTIQKNLIDNYDPIPDPVQPSRVQDPVVIQVGDRYRCIENFILVQESPEEEIKVILFQIDDTSDAGIGLFKTRWRMAGLGGDLNCAERARNISILYNMFSDKEGIVVHRLGGDRRSDSFSEKDGLTIREFIAGQLDKSEQTIRTNLYLVKYYSTEVMNDLAKHGASKRQMAYLGRRRTEFLKDYLSPDWSDERIEQEVSRHVVSEWFPQYDPNTEKQKPKLEQQVPSETGTPNETTTPSTDEAEKANDQKQEPPAEDSKKKNLGKSAPETAGTPPITGFGASLLEDRRNPKTGSEEDEDEAPETPTEDLSDAEEDPEEVVPDINVMFPNLNQKASIADKQTRVVELGNDLIRIGMEAPDPVTFSTGIERIMTELMKLLPSDSNASVTLNTPVDEGN